MINPFCAQASGTRKYLALGAVSDNVHYVKVRCAILGTLYQNTTAGGKGFFKMDWWVKDSGVLAIV